jgi:putative sterol carrier protein
VRAAWRERRNQRASVVVRLSFAKPGAAATSPPNLTGEVNCVATREELADSLAGFCETCNTNERLQTMNRGWNRHISITANDIDAAFTIIYEDGTAEVREGTSDEADLKVESDSETLTNIFYGEITPAEPYSDGSLRLLGSEDDILRLDFISLTIWGD